MKRFLILVALLLSASLSGQNLTVKYIANEGVMLQKNDKKVLIDALFDGYFEDYMHPNKELRSDMTDGLSPYNNVDLVLVTHRHRDHFETQVTGDFLKAHSESYLLSNYQVADSLRLDFADFQHISKRVIGHNQTLTKIESTINGIVVIAFFIEHAGGRRDPPAENLCYIINMDGQNVLHVGDADMDINRFEQLNLKQHQIDVALVPYWYLTEENEIVNAIGAENFIGIHFPKAPSKMALKAIQENYPKAHVFQKQLEVKQY